MYSVIIPDLSIKTTNHHSVPYYSLYITVVILVCMYYPFVL